MKRNVNNTAPPRNETSHRANVLGAADQQGLFVGCQTASGGRHCGRVYCARGQGGRAEMCQASSRTGFQSDVHHHRSFRPHGATTRQQNITADLAPARREPRRRVESKGNILLYPSSLLKQQLDSLWVSETLTCCLQRNKYTTAIFSPRILPTIDLKCCSLVI